MCICKQRGKHHECWEVKNGPPYQYSSSFNPNVDSTPFTRPWCLPSVFACAAADIRLLFQLVPKTRGVQRGTEKHEQDNNKCTRLRCNTDCCKPVSRGKSSPSRKAGSQCMSAMGLDPPSACPIWVKCLRLQPYFESSAALQHAKREKHAFCLFCSLVRKETWEKLSIWYLHKYHISFETCHLCAKFQNDFEACTFLCHTCFWGDKMKACPWGETHLQTPLLLFYLIL